MRALVFALEFRGKAGPVPGVDGAREANTSASAGQLTTYAGGDWLREAIARAAQLPTP